MTTEQCGQDQLPIGLFDSGVGGLTVLDAMRRLMPGEDYLFLGDTARVPYGAKSQKTIVRYSLQAAAKLIGQRIKLLVIACNTATAAALPALRETWPDMPIIDVIEKGYIPVIATVGCDSEGNTYNVNADTAASHIAGALGAECLISMTDIAGILEDRDDPTTLIPVVKMSEAPELVGRGIISGGMIPKVECCIDAIRRGVKKVFIIDGRVPHAILMETLTNEGIGTMFTPD